MYWNPIRRVFLAWAVILLIGFWFTYSQITLGPTDTNIVWAVLAVCGLAYMKKQMPFSDHGLRDIFFVWFAIIVLGILFSEAIFYWPPALPYSGYLGAIWLTLMALGHCLTGILDRKKLYILTVAIQLAAAFLIVELLPSIPALFATQYLVAGIVGAFSMVLLILYA